MWPWQTHFDIEFIRSRFHRNGEDDCGGGTDKWPYGTAYFSEVYYAICAILSYFVTL